MNKNTARARKRGFCSQLDEETNGNKIFKGSCCDTDWNAKASNKRGRKIYQKNRSLTGE